jgi:hypothetical protein
MNTARPIPYGQENRTLQLSGFHSSFCSGTPGRGPRPRNRLRFSSVPAGIFCDSTRSRFQFTCFVIHCSLINFQFCVESQLLTALQINTEQTPLTQCNRKLPIYISSITVSWIQLPWEVSLVTWDRKVCSWLFVADSLTSMAYARGPVPTKTFASFLLPPPPSGASNFPQLQGSHNRHYRLIYCTPFLPPCRAAIHACYRAQGPLILQQFEERFRLCWKTLQNVGLTLHWKQHHISLDFIRAQKCCQSNVKRSVNWSQRYDRKFREFSALQCYYENALHSGSLFFTAKGVAGIAVKYWPLMAGSTQSRPMYLRKNSLKINQVNKVTTYFLFALCYYCYHVTLSFLLSYFAAHPVSARDPTELISHKPNWRKFELNNSIKTEKYIRPLVHRITWDCIIYFKPG